MFYDGTPICSETVVWSGSRPSPRELDCRIASSAPAGRVRPAAASDSTGRLSGLVRGACGPACSTRRSWSRFPARRDVDRARACGEAQAGWVVAMTAAAATGAFGGSGGSTITTSPAPYGASPGDGGPATRRRICTTRGEWRWTGKGTSTSRDAATTASRKVSPAGRSRRSPARAIAGFSGDGGPATSAQLYVPDGRGGGRAGERLHRRHGNHRVRKVSPGGTITTFAGTGTPGFSGDGGPATSAQLDSPYGVAVDGQGNVYIADTRQPRAQGEPRRDDHDVRRHGHVPGLLRGRRPGDLGAAAQPGRAWRWTGRGTSTSPTPRTTACAR